MDECSKAGFITPRSAYQSAIGRNQVFAGAVTQVRGLRDNRGDCRLGKSKAGGTYARPPDTELGTFSPVAITPITHESSCGWLGQSRQLLALTGRTKQEPLR